MFELNQIQDYSGDDPYLLQLSRKTVADFNDFEKEYIETNLYFKGIRIEKNVRITDKAVTTINSKSSQQVLNNTVFIQWIVGETKKWCHCFGKVNIADKKFTYFWIKQNQWATYHPCRLYNEIEVDWNKYTEMDSKNRVHTDAQKMGVRYVLGGGNFLLLGTGLGKTYAAITAMLEAGYKKILIVCLSANVTNWGEELSFLTYDYATIPNGKTFVPPQQFTVINYEIIHKHEAPLINEMFDCIILDEGHSAASGNSIRNKALNKIIKASNPRIIVCTATPAEKLEKYVEELRLTKHPEFRTYPQRKKILDRYTENDTISKLNYAWIDSRITNECNIQLLAKKNKIYLTPNGTRFKVGRGGHFSFKQFIVDMLEVYMNKYVFINGVYDYCIETYVNKKVIERLTYHKTNNSINIYHKLEDKKKLLHKFRYSQLPELDDSITSINFKLIYKINGTYKHLNWGYNFFNITIKSKYVNLKSFVQNYSKHNILYIKQTDEIAKKDLPDKEYINIEYELSNEMRVKYEQYYDEYFKKSLKENPNAQKSDVVKQLVLKKFLAEQKIVITSEVMESLVPPEDTFVIATAYNDEIDKFIDLYKDQGLVIRGGLTAKKKQQITKDLYDDSIRCLLLNMKAGGTGLNVQAANWMVINAPDYSTDQEEQVEGRIWRYGQIKKCYFVRIFFKNTKEDRVREIQDEKSKLKKQLFQHKWRY